MIFPRARRRFSPRSPVIIFVFGFGCAFLDAAEKDARVTVVVRDVKLLAEDASPRAAALNETVHEDTAVRTGDESRSELTFVDLTITRLGANTVFSFNKAGRDVRLNSGAILVRVPKNSGGATIQTNACSVAITGTTLVLEGNRAGRNRLYLLEGGARMALKKRPNDWRNVAPGQVLDVPAGATELPEAKNFDVDRFMRTNPLITDFPPLPSRGLIAASNPDERVYASQPVGGGPSRPAPPFVRPPPHGPPGGRGNPVGNNPPNPGNPPGPGGKGGVKAPKKPAPPNVAGAQPVIGKAVPQQPGAVAGQGQNANAKPAPLRRKRKVPPPQP